MHYYVKTVINNYKKKTVFRSHIECLVVLNYLQSTVTLWVELSRCGHAGSDEVTPILLTLYLQVSLTCFQLAKEFKEQFIR